MNKKELADLYLRLCSFKDNYSRVAFSANDRNAEFLKFKTGGMRAIMKDGFDGINDITTNMLGTVLSTRFSSIAIGFDHRMHSDRFAIIVAKIFQLKNKKVKVFRHCTTPYLAWESLKYDVGLMITASHNPKEFNGFKVYKEGSQIVNPLDIEIEEEMKKIPFTNIYNKEFENYWKGDLEQACSPIDYDEFFKSYGIQESTTATRVIPVFSGLFGVSSPFIARSCEYFNIQMNMNSIQNTIDGLFPNIQYPNPEAKRPWELLASEINSRVLDAEQIFNSNESDSVIDSGKKLDDNKVLNSSKVVVDNNGVEGNTDEEENRVICDKIGNSSEENKGIDDGERNIDYSKAGTFIEFEDTSIPNSQFYFMCDPDGDRFGLAEVKNKKLRIFNGNEIAKIFLWYFLKKFNYSRIALVNTFLCDDFFNFFSKENGILYSQTKTGFKHVSAAVKKIRKENFEILAYEDTLGFLIGSSTERDGVKAAIIMHAILQETTPDAVFEFFKEFGTFYSYTQHVRMPDPQTVLDEVLERYLFETIHDGYFIFEDQIKIMLRISGTESVLKVYSFTNHKSESDLKLIVDEWIKKNIKKCK